MESLPELASCKVLWWTRGLGTGGGRLLGLDCRENYLGDVCEMLT